jgi:hypothetical protein
LFGHFAPDRSGAAREYKYGVAFSHTPGPIDPRPVADDTGYEVHTLVYGGCSPWLRHLTTAFSSRHVDSDSTHPCRRLLLADAAYSWTPSLFAGVSQLRHRRLRNIRDYGMFERREAAQYYPEVKRA